MPENYGKSYAKKHQKDIACSYGYKLICFDDKFSNHPKTYLGKDSVYNFINSMIEKSNHFSHVNLW